MRKDELNDPLGLEPLEEAGDRRARGLWVQLVLGGCALAVVGVGAAYLGSDAGGEPSVSAEIALPTKKAVAVPPSSAANSSEVQSSSPVTAGDIEDGVRVVRGGDPTAAGGTIIHVAPEAEANSSGLPPAPDPLLVENGRFGPLPKIGANGEKPFDAYRRPASASTSRPKIAIVITGMGLDEESTRSAATELPPETTFAFAPIGANLWAQVAEARRAGHETLLQAPMEALATDGGRWPHELTTEADAARNVADLRWSMSRFPGYFGVMNFLGSKLTADRPAITPILEEIASRGLAFIDDGTSAQSVAPEIAADLHMPHARADVVIDAANGTDGMDTALAELESVARARGSALGVAAGLPATIDRLESFTDELSSAGFELVPASALTSSPGDLSASTK